MICLNIQSISWNSLFRSGVTSLVNLGYCMFASILLCVLFVKKRTTTHLQREINNIYLQTYSHKKDYNTSAKRNKQHIPTNILT